MPDAAREREGCLWQSSEVGIALCQGREWRFIETHSSRCFHHTRQGAIDGMSPLVKNLLVKWDISGYANDAEIFTG